MAKKKNIHQTFLWQLILVGFISPALIGYLWISSEFSKFEIEVKDQKHNYIESQKNNLKREVESAFAFVEHMRSQADFRLKQSIKDRVYEAHSIALNIFKANKDQKSIEEIKTIIIDALRPIRFKNNRGYYFIFDLHGIERLSPVMPEMENQSLLDVTGGKGESVIPEMLDIIDKDKEGFYRYTWYKPEKKGYYPKVAFIKLLEPLNWVIGTGDYTDDVVSDIQQQCIDYLSKIQIGKDGYVFAAQWDGLSLSGPATGKNMLHVEDVNGVKIVQELIKAAESGGGFVHYVLPKFQGRKQAPKISYAVGVPQWQWYIGAGVYVDEIETVIDMKRTALNQRIKKNVEKIVIILLLLLFFIIAVVKMLSGRLQENLALFVQFFERAAKETVAIEKDALNFMEFEQLADSANRMVEKQKQAEGKLQAAHRRFLTVLDGIDATIYVSDIETYEILFMNKYMKQVFDGDQTGKTCFNVFRNESRPCKICNIDNLLDEHGKPTGLKIWQGRNPITGKWYVNYDRIIEWTDGRLVKLQIATDITEFKRLEDELRQAHKMESIGTLAGGIAHEFNNILSIIMGNIELSLIQLPEKSPAHKNLKAVKKASLRAKDIVKQLLSFSRKSDLNWQRLDLVSIVKDTLKLVRSSTPSSIQIIENIPHTVPHILADQTQIHQIIINLCTNASHAMADMENGIIEIHLKKITLKPENIRYKDMPPGDYIELIVKDNGCGIDPESIDKIFDPYFTTKAIGEGTGMGLAVVHGITKNHGGAITVSSQPGTGAAFHLIFPVTTLKNRQESSSERHKKVSSGKEKILFVDDEKEITDMVLTYFSRMGYTIHTHNDPQSALAQFKEEPETYDIVITDMMMPQMNGLNFSKKIYELRKDLPIIICTGNSSQIDDEKTKALYITAIAMKPLTMSELAELIRNTLNKP